MDTVYTIERLKELLTPVFEKYGIIKASVFGSYGRGDASAESDINLLVYIDDDFGLDEYVAFMNEAEAAVGKQIDILEYRSISKRHEEEVLREAVLLYEK